MKWEDMTIDQRIAVWEQEIDAIAAAIYRWLLGHPTTAQTVVVMLDCAASLDDYEKAADMDQYAESIIWSNMDAENWLGENYEWSDTFACALIDAIAKYRDWKASGNSEEG